MENMNIEFINSKTHTPACIIIRAGYQPSQTSFITQPDISQQVGFVVYPQGGVIKRHIHKMVDRHIRGNSEALMVRQGRCEIDIFDQEHNLLATRELHTGDFVLMIFGGHGFRVLEPTILLEVKLGPYPGPQEKEIF